MLHNLRVSKILTPQSVKHKLLFFFFFYRVVVHACTPALQLTMLLCNYYCCATMHNSCSSSCCFCAKTHCTFQIDTTHTTFIEHAQHCSNKSLLNMHSTAVKAISKLTQEKMTRQRNTQRPYFHIDTTNRIESLFGY